MMNMQRISKEVPRTAPLLRVYHGYCSLNAAAMRLLRVDYERKRYADIRVSDDGTVWICGSNHSTDYKITVKSARTGRINSVDLCNCLSTCLSGYGTYCIVSERHMYDVNLDKYYHLIQNKKQQDI